MKVSICTCKEHPIVSNELYDCTDGDELRDNVFVDAGGIDGAYHTVQTSGNAYYGDSTAWEDQPAIDEPDASDAAMESFCVTLRGYTNPTEKCIPNAIPTAQSPHGSQTGFTPPSGGP